MLPLGSLEQHGPQAPLGTDFMVGNTLPQYLKREMDKIDPDFPMLVMPTLPLGLSMEHLDFAGSLSLQPETYYHVLKDTITSLNRYGFKKFALLICHGGNRPAVDILARQLRYELGVLIFALNSCAFLDPKVQATISPNNTWDFHGGEMETSMVLAIKPETVHLKEAQTGYKKGGYRQNGHINFSNETALNWMGKDLQTKDHQPLGIGGNPQGATAKKGEIILTQSAKALIPALLEIKNWPLEV